jgi:hypothetical protein
MSLEPEEPRAPWLVGPRGVHASAVERSEHMVRIAPKDCRWAGFANDSNPLSRTQEASHVPSDSDLARLPDHGWRSQPP